ncbi:unnamed protein product [Caenorhabditis auriculariae]|uniref:Uncharacterized protein n=1 Tax=Caenorhabditis auriculariae TaxID=2777116 RepID=A0A8S1H9Z0_9PELO|nr:unnamed protein product [Caenorhabditis auriculariae]
MDDEAAYHPYIPRPPLYYNGYPHNYRSPFVLSRPYLAEEDYAADYYREVFAKTTGTLAMRDYERRWRIFDTSSYYIKVLAYAQIFIAGVLLVSDVSRLVLLWNYIQFSGAKIEMMAQAVFPLFALVVGFLTLTTVLNPSATLTKTVSVILVATIIPNFVMPKSSAMVSAAAKAVELARATEQTALWKDASTDVDMIRSETHHRIARLLSLAPSSRWPLGVSDITSLPQDFVLMIEYMLIGYSIFSASLIVFYILSLVCLFRLLSVQ